jgi:hypothetical protein
VIDEMLVFNTVSHEWEVLRWFRAKADLIRRETDKALEDFLLGHLDYDDHYQKYFQDDLTEILQHHLPDNQGEVTAAALAAACAQNEADAVDKVNKILDRIGDHMDNIADGALARKATDLTNEYHQHEPAAVKLVDGLLAATGSSIHSLMLQAMTSLLDYIERIDRLITLAEIRRDASLREIDRRRATLAGRLRKSLRDVEEDQVELVEATPVKAKKSA